jgi:hypothetical protein
MAAINQLSVCVVIPCSFERESSVSHSSIIRLLHEKGNAPCYVFPRHFLYIKVSFLKLKLRSPHLFYLLTVGVGVIFT